LSKEEADEEDSFVLIASLFLIAWGLFVFAQTPPAEAPAGGSSWCWNACYGGSCHWWCQRGSYKGKVTDTVTPRAQ